MKLHFAKPLPVTPELLLRRAGYTPHFDRKMNKMSYVRRLTSDFYPRFHCYVKETDKVITFDMHLDQKKASYKGSSMHNGEYDGPTVEKEMMRMKAAFHAAVQGG